MVPVLAALAALAPGAQTGATARYVIAIGYNGADGDPRGKLEFADDDAARFFLEEKGGAKRAWLLTTFDTESARAFGDTVELAKAPTADELSRTLGEAFWQMRQDRDKGTRTELVVYFAGHGDITDGGEGYVVLADEKLTRSLLESEVLIPSPAATNHLLIDACASAYMLPRGGHGAPAGEPVSPSLFLKRTPAAQAAWARTGAIVATSDASAVHESSEIGGGLFSFALRSALVGAGDVNGDGRVEYAEAAAFIAAQSSAARDTRARVSVLARAPAQRPHAALADLARVGASHFLVVDQPRTASLRVLDDHGEPYADVHREGAAPPAILALMGSSYYVVVNGNEEAVLVPRREGAYALSSLSWKPAPRARDAAPALGKAPVAFGPQFVDGYLVGAKDLVPPLDGQPVKLAFAPDGQPEVHIPWWTLAGTAGSAAAVLAAGAVACAVGNSLSLVALDESFRRTGTLDPALSLQTDTWLAASVSLGVGALATGVVAGGLAFVATEDDK